jgi:membrane-associated HD superfamily phosphohydrolase
MANKNPIGFSKRTFSASSKIHIKKKIISAIESSPELRKEIARVFQQANRRIQNVENSGIISPAVIALNKGDVKGFAKFSMKHDWNDLKIEYSKAVSFLQQPTSTASGTREYSNYLKKSYNLNDKEFKLMQDKLMGKIASVSDEKFLEQYLMQYKDFTGELEQESRDVSDQIESDAVKIADSLQNNIDNAGEMVESKIQKILDSFKKFGL